MKKAISFILSSLLCCSFLLPVAGCGIDNSSSDSNSSTSEQTQTPASGYLALNAYNVKLKVGETFTIDVKKYNDKDEEQTVEEISYTSELASAISVADDGTITALQTGEAYVNIVADGMEAAVFVTVQNASIVSGLSIRFASKKLYSGVPSQPIAYILDEGVVVDTPTDVTWSVEGDDVLEIKDGVVTPKKTGIATLKASCTYDNKEYTAEIQVEVVEPIYYAFTKSSLKLADYTTVSGEANASYTSSEIKIKVINVLSGEVNDLDDEKFSVSIGNEEVMQSEVLKDGTIQLMVSKPTEYANGLEAPASEKGSTTMNAVIAETGETLTAKLEVATPISTIADMDAIALSPYNNDGLFAKSYLLVNDIDYKGDVIMPIGSYMNSVGKLTAGIQYQYRLKKTANGYAMEDRAKYGKAGTGLTLEEFKVFAKLHSTTSIYNLSFSGTFDGNGHSIIDAAIFYGAWVSVVDAANYASAYTGIFGKFSGTLKNVSFEKISMQDPRDERWSSCELSAHGLNRIYTNEGTIVDGVLKRDVANGVRCYRATSYSLICYTSNATIENVYFELTKTLGISSSGQTGIIASWATGATLIKNCVVNVTTIEQAQTKTYAMCGTGAKTTVVLSNNFVLGMQSFHQGITGDSGDTKGKDKKLKGYNGNWWLGDSKALHSWNELFALEAEENATDVRSPETVANSYDPSVWDMSNFGADKDGRPMMIKGCSAK